jgi:membrane protein implicated in regulation of membrane protease activity
VKVVWFSFFLVWMFILLYVQDLWQVLWWLLFFMWVGLLMHYTIAFRRWSKEMRIRREERRKFLLEGTNVPSETNE